MNILHDGNEVVIQIVKCPFTGKRYSYVLVGLYIEQNMTTSYISRVYEASTISVKCFNGVMHFKYMLKHRYE